MPSFIKRCFLIFFLLCTLSLSSSNEVYLSFLRGGAIKDSATLNVEAPPIGYSGWQTIDSLSVIKVRLALPEDRLLIHPSRIYKVKYQIKLDNSPTPITDSLEISYNYQNDYHDIALAVYQGYTSARLILLDVDPAIMPEDITLELQLHIVRYPSAFLPAPTGISNRYNAATNELQLTWNYLPGADSYDVEWLFIDNPKEKESIRYDFRNATRINTGNNYYNISLSYPKGNILYRIRGVITELGYTAFNMWSYPVSKGSVLPALNDSCRYDYNGLQNQR